MVKFTIELDDGTAERLAAASRARHISVEDLLREEAEHVALPKDAEIPNASHRSILAALDRPEGYYDSPRDEMHDRERGRAEAYLHARRALLALIDATEGDLGAERWDRKSLYDT